MTVQVISASPTKNPAQWPGQLSGLRLQRSGSGIYAVKLLHRLFHPYQAGGQLPTAFISRIRSFVRLASARSCGLNPPLKALRLVVALPSGVVGPVDISHGLHVRINAA